MVSMVWLPERLLHVPARSTRYIVRAQVPNTYVRKSGDDDGKPINLAVRLAICWEMLGYRNSTNLIY